MQYVVSPFPIPGATGLCLCCLPYFAHVPCTLRAAGQGGGDTLSINTTFGQRLYLVCVAPRDTVVRRHEDLTPKKKHLGSRTGIPPVVKPDFSGNDYFSKPPIVLVLTFKPTTCHLSVDHLYRPSKLALYSGPSLFPKLSVKSQ